MYKAQEKSWTDSDIFIEWIKQLDRKCLAQNCKVGFIVDNCPAHQHVPDLDLIDPNTISVTQPMDQGFIRSLKTEYQAKIISKCINVMESNKELPKIIILDAMTMLEQSWSTLPDIIVINCFKNVGTSKESRQDSIKDTDHPFTQP